MSKIENIKFNNLSVRGAFRANKTSVKKAHGNVSKETADSNNNKLKYALMGLAAAGAVTAGVGIALYRKKVSNLQALSQENEKIRLLALQREQDDKMLEHARNTQDALMEVLYPQTPEKSAQESANVFEEKFRAIEDSHNRSDKVSYRVYQVINDKQYGQLSVQGKREKVLKKIKPETLKALNDDQIRILLTRPTDAKFKDVIKVLENRFTPEKLREISVSDDWFRFTHDIFDGLEGKVNLDTVVEKYNSKIFNSLM